MDGDVDIQLSRFNPRAREERDANQTGRPACAQGFNPRAREERDIEIVRALTSATLFQSTRP